MVRDHVGLLSDQGLRRIGFLPRVVPGRGPDDADLNIGIHALRAQRKGIDALKHFRNRERGDVAANVRLRGCAGELARKIAGFIKAPGVVGDVFSGLVARRMLELDVRELLRNLENGIHVAERSREDELVALLREVAQNAFSVGVLGDVFDRRHLDLVAELRFRSAAGDVVLRRPAFLVRRAHVHEGNLERLTGLRLRSRIGRLGGRARLRGSLGSLLFAAGRKHESGRAGERELESKTLVHFFQNSKKLKREKRLTRSFSFSARKACREKREH